MEDELRDELDELDELVEYLLLEDPKRCFRVDINGHTNE